MSGLYLALNIAVLFLPLIFSWHARIRFVDEWRAFGAACVLVAIAFLGWDIAFTEYGIWGFDDRYLVGVKILGLPIEEWMFFLCIPYACVFTYHVLKRARPLPDVPEKWVRPFIGILAIGSLSVGLLHVTRWYTVTVCIMAAAFAVYLYVARPKWLGRMLLSCGILVIPFIATNGILTGIAFWESQVINVHPDLITNHVVWYNNVHNLGVRLFTIPVDDFFYAFVLIGLNISLFEYFRTRLSGINKG